MCIRDSSEHSLGLKADGSIQAWGAGLPGESGSPHYGQCDVPAPNADFIGIAAGRYHSLGLKADGSIVAWGWNRYGQCNVPAPNADFIGIAGGGQRSLAIRGYPPGDLDIKPGSCPNSFNRKSHGVLPVALLGSDEFDVMKIDIDTVELARADGVGGSVAPHEGPPGPHSVHEDVGTPFHGEACDCHEAGGDGIVDLFMKFKSDGVVVILLLNELDPGALVELVVTGSLLDGTPFAATDCIRLVPPGTPPGVVAVESNAAGAWIEVEPLDLQLDGGGFADFQRTYPLGSVVSFTAEPSYQSKRFVGWRLDGEFHSTDPTISFTTTDDVHQIKAVILWPGDMDDDGYVDLSDFGTFAVCYGSVVSAPLPSCCLLYTSPSPRD